ncbi:methylamine utilization protein [Altererythrobacter sp. H2]|uniref:cupredoxin domain-containing protein n=1 Tax=Altererythrobacter sp. H2 TaxID=3108391 RepID=UPI002B4BE0AF|nr:methylamine utilization protein [Altererythrobacter sp. H2]WRK94553.1 methylamine utilization protein [Altererythrobacter sp. H2]
MGKQITFAMAVLLASIASYVHAQAGTSLRVQVVDERGMPLRDAIIELHSSGKDVALRPAARAAMAQRNLEFTPGTIVVAKGSTVAFPNLDQVRHSIYSFSKPARFKIDLYGRDQTRTHTFNVPGSVSLGCNIHDNMRGYIRVTDTPHAARTDLNGYVDLNAVPVGAARLTVWHPRLRSPANELVQALQIASGKQARKITVKLR